MFVDRDGLNEAIRNGCVDEFLNSETEAIQLRVDVSDECDALLGGYIL